MTKNLVNIFGNSKFPVVVHGNWPEAWFLGICADNFYEKWQNFKLTIFVAFKKDQQRGQYIYIYIYGIQNNKIKSKHNSTFWLLSSSISYLVTFEKFLFTFYTKSFTISWCIYFITLEKYCTIHLTTQVKKYWSFYKIFAYRRSFS